MGMNTGWGVAVEVYESYGSIFLVKKMEIMRKKVAK